MLYRNIITSIKELCFNSQKMVFISGPRQIGKTTLSKQLAEGEFQSKYITWDDSKNRKIWNNDPLSFISTFNQSKKSLIIFDEIHKAKQWKTKLKGIWDQRPPKLDLIVTGPAQLNTLRKAGDSLIGRYYHFNLHPFTVGEILQKSILKPDELMKKISENNLDSSSKKVIDIYNNLKKFSGFPEPYIQKNFQKHNLWKKNRKERLVREDLRDLSHLQDLTSVEILMSLLPEKIGAGLSVENLRSDLETSHNTVKRWLTYLEAVYYHYSIRPYFKNISNAIRKEPKIYLYDYTEIENSGALYENIIANHLKKTCDYWTDTGYGDFKLHYVKNKQGAKIDFLISENKKPWLCIETKLSKTEISKPVLNLLKKLNCPLIILNENTIESSLKKVDGVAILKTSVDQFLQHLA